jgi:ferrochelatase
MVDRLGREAYDAVLLVSFGGPEGPSDVVPFLENVTRGRGIPPDRLAQVARQYDGVGGRSPINDQNRDLIAALRDQLHEQGLDLPVYWGNRNWHPFLADTLAWMAEDGVRRAVAVPTAAYSSYSSCRQYQEDLAAARVVVGERAPVVDKVRPYFNHPGFIEAVTDRVAATLADWGEPARESHLVFTAHSIPTAMAAACDYELQLREVARLVVEGLAKAGGSATTDRGRPWELVWQSRSGPPHSPWLEPDVNEHLGRLASEGVDTALLVPIGFLSDHMEVVYDLDTVALAQARDLGLEARRAPTVGTHPAFVAALADLIGERRRGTAPVAVGRLPPRPHRCPPGCCPIPGHPAQP